jgi:hypothetical protein
MGSLFVPVDARQTPVNRYGDRIQPVFTPVIAGLVAAIHELMWCPLQPAVFMDARNESTAVRLSVLFSFPQKGGRPGWGLMAVQDGNHFNRLRRHQPPPQPSPFLGEGVDVRSPLMPVLDPERHPNVLILNIKFQSAARSTGQQWNESGHDSNTVTQGQGP